LQAEKKKVEAAKRKEGAIDDKSAAMQGRPLPGSVSGVLAAAEPARPTDGSRSSGNAGTADAGQKMCPTRWLGITRPTSRRPASSREASTRQ
jgi:hypothetical protein